MAAVVNTELDKQLLDLLKIPEDNIDDIADVIRRGANVNQQDVEGITPLMTCLKMVANQKTLMKTAATGTLDKRKILDEQNAMFSEFMVAKVNLLISSGANINIQRTDGMTALIIAIMSGNTDSALILISRGANLNLQDSNGNTALILAVLKKHFNITMALIEHGADVNLKAKRNIPALMVASNLDDSQFALALINHGAQMNERDDQGRTALIIAIENGQINNALMLIKRGADVILTTKDRINFISY